MSGKIYRVDHAPRPGQNFYDMLTRDHFAVANFLVEANKLCDL